MVVLGGGDTSADCLGNALREGAAEVHEVAHGEMPPRERDPQETWPAWPRVLRSHPVHEEGGSRRWRFETVAIEGDGRVQRVRGQDGSAIDAELVLVAIGFSRRRADPVYPGSRCGSRMAACAARRTTCSRPATAFSAPT